MFISFDPRQYNMYALLSVKNGGKEGGKVLGLGLGGQQRKTFSWKQFNHTTYKKWDPYMSTSRSHNPPQHKINKYESETMLIHSKRNIHYGSSTLQQFLILQSVFCCTGLEDVKCCFHCSKFSNLENQGKGAMLIMEKDLARVVQPHLLDVSEWIYFLRPCNAQLLPKRA